MNAVLAVGSSLSPLPRATCFAFCHRRIIADVAVAKHGVRVVHLMHDGRLVAHELSGGARLDERGDVVWDGAQ